MSTNSVGDVVETSQFEQPTAATTSTTKMMSSLSPSSSSTVASSSATLSSSSSSAALSDSDYAKVGLSMWLNNAPDRAEQHFRAKLQSTPIFAGYAFTVSMVGYLWGVGVSKTFIPCIDWDLHNTCKCRYALPRFHSIHCLFDVLSVFF